MTTEPTYSGLQFNDLLRVQDWSVTVEWDGIVAISHKSDRNISVRLGWSASVSPLVRSFASSREIKQLVRFAKDAARHAALMAAVRAERNGR